MKCAGCNSSNRPDAQFCQKCGRPLLAVAASSPSPAALSTCPVCQGSNSANARFCQHCGRPLPASQAAAGTRCPACGAETSPTAKFCGQCSQSLQKTGDPPSLPPPLAPPSIPVSRFSQQQTITNGHHNLQIGSVNGGKVNIVMDGKIPPPRPRPKPVKLPPSPFVGLLDRENELEAVKTTLAPGKPIEFCGPAGLGKTTLLQHLGQPGVATPLADGLVYHDRRAYLDKDILQLLFDDFYERDPNYIPTESQIRFDLQNIRALIVLDDLPLDRDQFKSLINSLPGCTFIVATTSRVVWDSGRCITLKGLPLEAALTLLERELNQPPPRPLLPGEKAKVESLYKRLEGHPLHLLRAAALVREQNLTFDDVLQRLQKVPSPTRALTMRLLNLVPEAGRQVLAALATLDGATVQTDHLSALTGITDVVPVLRPLLRQKLVKAHSPHYSLTGDLGKLLQEIWDLTPWTQRALAHFTTWVEANQATPGLLLEEAGPILQTLERGVQAGLWPEVLRLGRALEEALILGARWGAWGQTLGWLLQAATALGDRAAEAWALHQLGSRAMCLEETATARTYLEQALKLRQASGDQAGAALTQHNLNQLALVPPPKPPQQSPPVQRKAPQSWWKRLLDSSKLWIILVPAALVLFLWSLVLATAIIMAPPTPTRIVAIVPTDTPTLTPSPTVVTPTSTPLPTSAPSRTPTFTPIPPTPTFTPIPPTPTFTFTPIPPTPTFTPIPPTPTFTPIPPTSTFTPIPPTPTFAPTPSPTPSISLGVDPETIDFGKCAILFWDVQHIKEIYLDGEGVAGQDSLSVCPDETTTYSFRVVLPDNTEQTHPVTLTVIPPPTPDLPDLIVSVSGPDSAWAGSNILVDALVQNIGSNLAPGTDSNSNGYMVDIVLSTDTNVPDGWADYSPNYQEDVLLEGGRFSNTPDLAPGQSTSFRADYIGLPADTPEGQYYLCAKVDPGQAVAELKENNNVSCTVIQVNVESID